MRITVVIIFSLYRGKFDDNLGGTISLLALKGLFTLIHKHNLDYPEFYTKLYALFDGQVLNSPYRARFLELADLFLRSS